MIVEYRLKIKVDTILNTKKVSSPTINLSLLESTMIMTTQIDHQPNLKSPL